MSRPLKRVIPTEVVVPPSRNVAQRARFREERLAVIAEQVANGELVVRQASDDERATWATQRDGRDG